MLLFVVFSFYSICAFMSIHVCFSPVLFAFSCLIKLHQFTPTTREKFNMAAILGDIFVHLSI